MTTVNSADKMQGLVLVRTASVWTYIKGAYSLALKFGVYYFKFHCKVLIFGGGGGGLGRGLSVEFYGYVTKHNYSFQ